MRKMIALSVLLLIPATAYLAEFNGEDIDFIEFDCEAQSGDTDESYPGVVEFMGEEAMITLKDGDLIFITLYDKEITEWDYIAGKDEDDTEWILKIPDLKE